MFLDIKIPSKLGRISLVPPSEADDPFVAVLRSHIETRRYLRYFPELFSAADARDRRIKRESEPDLIDFHIHLAQNSPAATGATNTFVGSTGIFNIIDTFIGNSCEVGILISPDYFRGGLATEALYTVLKWVFEDRKFHRAEFNTGTDNLAMRGWLEKAGATLEGTKRECWVDPSTGGFTDVCTYSILEEEWREIVSGRLEERMNRGTLSVAG
ncbi:ribosomal-protein-alanine acetyltransferase [Favolaschia claudopus]|uniref:Ribosomal-protein-alanine acetyltransferase n=1 Tax=Favolaschia claudopus TaxID=2862362 RepID=A0AAW0EEI9_9AGAR